MKKRMRYYIKEGSLWFFYQETEEGRTFTSSGRIPEKTEQKGKEAIRKYVDRKIKRDIRKQRIEAGDYDQFVRSRNFRISTTIYGEVLTGRIISAENRILKVLLDMPCQGEREFHFGWNPDASDHQIFKKEDDYWNFTTEVLEIADKLLIDIYKSAIHYKDNKELIKLAEQMNELIPGTGGCGGG